MGSSLGIRPASDSMSNRIGSGRLVGAFQTAWLLRGTVSRRPRPALSRCAIGALAIVRIKIQSSACILGKWRRLRQLNDSTHTPPEQQDKDEVVCRYRLFCYCRGARDGGTRSEPRAGEQTYAER